MANYIEISEQSCVGCGMCVRECLDSAIVMRDGKVAFDPAGFCLRCGHCLAVCPTHSVHLSADAQAHGEVESEILEYDEATFHLNPDHLLNAIKFRRSVRYYLPQDVEEEKLQKILEAGRYTPTGANRQGVAFIVLHDQLLEVQRRLMKKFRFLARLAAFVGRFIKLPLNAQRLINKPDDFLFHGAPVAIVVIGNNPLDCSLATGNMELMAEAQGLGTLHNGIFTLLANISPAVRKMLGVPKGSKIINCLGLGYPAVRFHRTVTRKPAKIIRR